MSNKILFKKRYFFKENLLYFVLFKKADITSLGKIFEQNEI